MALFLFGSQLANSRVLFLPRRIKTVNGSSKEMKKDTILKLYVQSQIVLRALKDEKGQDLVEYALVIAVVCLGIISGMNTLANGINAAMGQLSSRLNSAIV